MRRLKADVSHRIRPRGPSIFTARWFRVSLGVGLALVVALAVGPSVAGWFGADLPRSVLRLSPWGGSDPAQPPTSDALNLKDKQPGEEAPPSGSPVASDPAPRVVATAAARTATSAPVATPPSPASVAAPARDATAGPALEAKGVARGSSVVGSAGTVVASASGSTGATAPPLPPARSTARTTPTLTAPAPAYWIQVGAFVDPKNAERLVERLRGDGYPATSSEFEQSRVMYRVVVVTPEGSEAPPDAMLEKARGLGFTVEPFSGGAGLTGPIPLRQAIEASHRLREQGIAVTLRQESGSATYRAVRVGAYATSREADEALASLQAKGIEGFVARDR